MLRPMDQNRSRSSTLRIMQPNMRNWQMLSRALMEVKGRGAGGSMGRSFYRPSAPLTSEPWSDSIGIQYSSRSEFMKQKTRLSLLVFAVLAGGVLPTAAQPAGSANPAGQTRIASGSGAFVTGRYRNRLQNPDIRKERSRRE
jgi:hypothetical protein